MKNSVKEVEEAILSIDKVDDVKISVSGRKRDILNIYVEGMDNDFDIPEKIYEILPLGLEINIQILSDG